MKRISREKSSVRIYKCAEDIWNEEWLLNNNIYMLAQHSNNEYSYLRFKSNDDIFIRSENIYKLISDEVNLNHGAELVQVINGHNIKVPYSQFMEYMACIELLDPQLFMLN